MPQRRAAKKDLKQNKKRRQGNLVIRKKIKTSIKNFKKSVENNDAAQSKKALREIYKNLDTAASKNIIHKNKAARKKGRFAGMLKKPASKQSDQ